MSKGEVNGMVIQFMTSANTLWQDFTKYWVNTVPRFIEFMPQNWQYIINSLLCRLSLIIYGTDVLQVVMKSLTLP